MMLLSTRMWIRPALLLGCAISALPAGCQGQTPATMKPNAGDRGIEATKAQMISLRDEFVKATVEAGFACPIAPPTILVIDVPSFGNYDQESNTLQTPAWEQLMDGERDLFYRLHGPRTSEAAAREEFETGVHHWVFVHEMGHWWQACRGVATRDKHYAAEFGANRIAAAYWQKHDSRLIAHERAAFEGLLRQAPSPIGEGQDAESYFDANYEKLGPTPAYIWFQARMCNAAFDENPAPTFAQVLKQTTP